MARTRIRFAVAVSSIFAVLLAEAAGALIIDNFEEGDFNVVDTSLMGGDTLAEQTGLLTTNVAGGTRLVSVTATVGSLTGALITSPADDGALLTATTQGFARFYYDGIGGGSVASGSSGALNLDLSAFTSVTVNVVLVEAQCCNVSLQLGLWDSGGFEFGSNVPVPATGLIVLGLSGFNSTTMNDIKQIQLTVSGLLNGTSVEVLNVEAVPEPDTALLTIAGLVVLAAHRRRSR